MLTFTVITILVKHYQSTTKAWVRVVMGGGMSFSLSVMVHESKYWVTLPCENKQEEVDIHDDLCG